ncbi:MULTISPECIES: carbon-nitrogen hydrolase family protein [unclassified Colwellia]|uniref:carbon-nitrogen hydrolase family protein n=1 Tax=unclassified Colwellia TaxID=196834 RepID=UPI0015F63E95|nr:MULTISPECIES: carbon-nitrogen hydrolase family protein [unclassified Colwellia]MBA6232083.1 carbon-nitrogen hydrolase family protein [Colwellia sp. MB02u-7]MBA6237219.1 carbon-nitrogen hydrolase family protein [Colwellia sp. MB02u-11]MBA6254693.1 carbon-nitrogen hydrolase family protein [Colwellia sp. MB3u-28]MBA6260421.1 carbon-nitrogen hydrolase family protein [Colwellia sp. MB3u-41]MBA6300214.1 carbon-nitrogen hydrolase family protein [Colwellia sp. MB3u-22]
MVRLTAIQLCSVPNVEENLVIIDAELARLAPHSANDEHIVVLPECCLFFGGKDAEQLSVSKLLLKDKLAQLAKKYKVFLVAGSIPLVTSPKIEDKFTNSSCIFSPQGEELIQYDKIHLFDVNVEDSEKSYRESRYTQAGHKICCLKSKTVNIGLTICYDLRFPELYRQLQQLGADIITVPSAFTAVTGKAHWQILLQARAIENQVYIVAAGQQGIHCNGRETWGHSMIISPWGEILTCLEQGIGSISIEFSREALEKVRKAMPVIEHNQFENTLKTPKLNKLIR